MSKTLNSNQQQRERNKLKDWARGPFLYDAAGKEYLDFLSGFSVSSLGNNYQEINEVAIRKTGAP
jgi:4-aminobutyrate aminotransferase-like enzyme